MSHSLHLSHPARLVPRSVRIGFSGKSDRFGPWEGFSPTPKNQNIHGGFEYGGHCMIRFLGGLEVEVGHVREPEILNCLARAPARCPLTLFWLGGFP